MLNQLIVEDLIHTANDQKLSSAFINEYYEIIYNEMDIKEIDVDNLLFLDSTLSVSHVSIFFNFACRSLMVINLLFRFIIVT